tara:strand:+ start:835 stop:3456 length:2622 start_codon:yes stop_codon:yes gene_type:complete
LDQVYLYFFNGLAFVLMGVAVLTRIRSTSGFPEIRDLQWIALFGLFHGANEWLVMFSILERSPAILQAERMLAGIFHTLSYVFLMLGAVRLLGALSWQFVGSGFVLAWGMATLWLWHSGVPAAEFDVSNRLLLGAPASFVAVAAFLHLAWSPDSNLVSGRQQNRGFMAVAIAFGSYGIFTLVPEPSGLFPATYLNADWFAETVGLDVPWFRAASAAAIAGALLSVMGPVSEEHFDGFRQREGRLLGVLDKSPMGVSIFALDPFERLYANGTFADLVGRQQDGEQEFAGRETFVNIADYEQMAEDLKQGIESDDVVAQRVRPSTGDFWWSSVSTRRIRLADKDVSLVWTSDISEHKEREKQLAASAGQLRDILDSCSTAVCIFHQHSENREYVYASNRMLELFDARNISDLNTFGFFNTFADKDIAIDMRDRHLAGKFSGDTVFERVRLDGSRFWVMGTASEIEFEGEPAIIAWITDISGRMEEQRQIASNAEQLSRILESSHSGVTIFRPHSHERMFATQRVLEQFGCDSLEQLNMIDFRETFVRQKDAEIAMKHVLKGTGERSYALERRRPDGTTWWGLIDIRDIEFQGEQAKIAWHHDITAMKRIEADLRETLDTLRHTQEELVEAEKMASLGGLIAGVAHEINTPVGICMTAASAMEDQISMLGRDYDGGTLTQGRFKTALEGFATAADLVTRNAKRAGELISSFKQVAVDQTSDQRRQFLLLDYIEDVLVSLSPELSRRKIEYKLMGDRQIEVNGYPGAIGQIITNLALNAALHAYDEAHRGVIEILCEEEKPERAVITFRDFGKGMDAETVRKVFDPFFTTKRGKGGTGLGMHIVYNLVTQRLGGRISCRSAPGEGTTVELRFPSVCA